MLMVAIWVPWQAMGEEKLSPASLFMPDGQMVSHPIRVQVNRAVYESLQPRLSLFLNDSLNGRGNKDLLTFTPKKTIPKQMLHDKDGHSYEGTLLLFDLSGDKHIDIDFYKTGIRVTPILIWCSKEVDSLDECSEADKRKVASEVEVYIGDITHAIIVTILIFFLFISILGLLLKLHNKKDIACPDSFWGSLLSLLCDVRGELSLSKSQMALWTLAIGCMVFIFGLTRLEVPVIPEQLVALMGMSIGTTIISRMSASPSEQKAGNRKPELQDLLMVQTKVDGKIVSDTSLAKVQLIFWTLLTLFLFSVKSLVEGELWEVPWELVVLMGMSQGGYLARYKLHETEKPKGK